MLRTYKGSCHCGAVRFEAELDLAQPSYRCNCSICRRNRFWPAIAKADGFRLLAGEDMLTEYLFNTKTNEHFFCKRCGVRAFGVGNETPIGKMVGVNIGCLEGVSEEELSKIPITCVIPHVPVRQWVLSLPIPLRLLLAAQPELVTPVLQVVCALRRGTTFGCVALV